jgi:hypothetical protein
LYHHFSAVQTDQEDDSDGDEEDSDGDSLQSESDVELSEDEKQEEGEEETKEEEEPVDEQGELEYFSLKWRTTIVASYCLIMSGCASCSFCDKSRVFHSVTCASDRVVKLLIYHTASIRR